MTWFHLVDQYGSHYVIPSAVCPVIYFLSQATDGSQPISMYLNGGMVFEVPASLFTTIVGVVPAAISVINEG
jgi:hypothetical protein